MEVEPPVPFLLDVQQKLGLKRGPGWERCCAVCSAASRLKCGHCLATHYCSRACQKDHWGVHQVGCCQPTPRVERHVAVALPDFACAREYQKWFCEQPSTDMFGVAILTRNTFGEKFGADAADRSMLHLALKGRPAFYTCDLYAAPAGPLGGRQ